MCRQKQDTQSIDGGVVEPQAQLPPPTSPDGGQLQRFVSSYLTCFTGGGSHSPTAISGRGE
jgi:hypothetical protein